MKMKTTHRLYMKEVASRKRQVRSLRQQGLTWTAIGVVLGVTRQRAFQLGRNKVAAQLTGKKTPTVSGPARPGGLCSQHKEV